MVWFVNHAGINNEYLLYKLQYQTDEWSRCGRIQITQALKDNDAHTGNLRRRIRRDLNL